MFASTVINAYKEHICVGANLERQETNITVVSGDNKDVAMIRLDKEEVAMLKKMLEVAEIEMGWNT